MRRSRGAGVGIAALAALTCAEPPAADWRVELGHASDALAARDSIAYRAAARHAVDALTPSELNRPFVMYHLARAEAWTGHLDSALRWLGVIRDERIESLMASYALVDSLFAPYRADPAFGAAMDALRGVPVTIEPVAGSLHLLVGAGSNVLASIGPDGVLLVDTGYGPAADALRAALSSVGAGPVSRVVNTHMHEDHVGGNAAFGGAATVVAHVRAAEAMAQPQEFMPGAVVPARTGDALPDVTVDAPWQVVFNGETIDVIPLPAHTDGDVVVHFTGSHVLHLGDNFFPRSGRGLIFPGADLAGFRVAMDELLARLAPDTRVVSGHDPVTTVTVLREQYGRTVAAIDLVTEGISGGLTADSITALGRAEGFPETWLRYFDRLLRGS